MKMYTNESQTAKLIELGFEKPKNVTTESWQEYERDNPFFGADTIEYIWVYSIGELIDMLDGVSELEITRYGSGWEAGDTLRAFTSEELIDTLFAMIVKLKEEGVI